MNGLPRRKYLILGFVTTIALLYALYLYRWVNPSLYLIRGFREFFTDTYFFGRFFDFPGNPADYFSRLFVQLYQYPLVASALTALVLSAIYLLGLQVWRGRGYSYWIPAIPVFVLMLMHNDYRHAIRFDLDMLALSAGLCLLKASFRRRRLSYVLFPVLLLALLYLNGILTALVFTAVSLCLAVFGQKGKMETLLALLAGALLAALLSRFVFGLTVHDLTREITDTNLIYPFRYYPFVLYGAVLLLPAFAFAANMLCERSRRVFPAKAACLYASAVTAAGFAILLCTADMEEKNGLSVQHCAINGQWEQALQHAQKCDYPDLDATLYTNEALYRTGKIYDELFLYNQSFGSKGLMSTEIANYSGIVPNQDIFLHLGALSLSIVWGTEATNVYGANPYVLRNLTKAYLAGGYIAEARKILHLLNHTPFCKAWAERYYAFTNDTTLIDRDPELRTYKQAQAPLAVVSTQSVLMNLYLLAKDSQPNKMAYDYLMIAALLDHKTAYFASYLSRLKDYGYTTIPKLYLEGLIYYSLYDTQLPLDIRDFTFDSNVLNRFESFRNDLLAAGRQPEQTKSLLEGKYKDTYWYYLLFVSNLKNEEKIAIFNQITS
jgi:hypothetical protein